MNRRHFLPLLASLPAVTWAQRPPGPFDPAQTAGFAEADITPPTGSERPGTYYKTYLTTINDPCKVRASVFGHGDARAAIVGIDALVIPRQVVLAARAKIEAQCGIPAASLLIGASHSHSSGPVGMIQPGQFDSANEFIQRLAYEESSAADPGYLALVERQIVSAVCQADATRTPALASFGSGHEQIAAINRRARMKSGRTITHPRQGNPDIASGPGPIDPEVGVIGAWDQSGRLLGCIVNFACHATSNPAGISANWIYWMERVIRGAFGSHVIVVYTAAPSGDITPVDNFGPHANRRGLDQQRFVGGRVGAEAIKALLDAQPGNYAPITAGQKLFKIPRRRPSPERLAKARALIQGPRPDGNPTDWVFAKETVLLDALIAQEPEVEVEVQAIQIGPAVFAASQAEYFVEYGLEIKEQSNFPLTLPVSLANGFIGYVPTEEAFGPHGGGYETRLTSYSNLIPTAGRQIADATHQLIAQFKPAALPERPKHPPFTAPWTYGNTPPQVE